MKQLRTKVILLSMTALFVLLAVIVAGMNLLNYRSVVEEADGILAILTSNKGHFPGVGPGDRPGGLLPPELSPEIPYESRFFSVIYDASGRVVQVDVNKIAAVDDQKAIALSKEVKDRCGFVESYRYAVSREGEGTRITFLDCGRKLSSFRRFLVSSIVMSLLGFGVVFGVFCVLAGRIIQPISESYEKQKRFITDAGHEIKTPLTIINANADILEMELGAHESLADIKSQTLRLKTLTEDLVTLSRMEEGAQGAVKIDFPVSEVVEEAAHDFLPLFAGAQKVLRCQIEPMLTLCADPRGIRQLVSILLENALKYAPEGTQTLLKLEKHGRNLMLTVSNPTQTPVDPEQLKLVFDRFYRTDASRSSQTGGYGIGLSIAKAIVTAHGGRIKAATQDGGSFAVTATLPK